MRDVVLFVLECLNVIISNPLSNLALSSTVAQLGSETIGDVCTRPGSRNAVASAAPGSPTLV